VRSDARLASLSVPAFDGSLTPIFEFLESVLRIIPDCRFIFILDEFDELPVEVYKDNSLARPFFLALRSISARVGVGFILVGGEKMELVIHQQGDTLNKFAAICVDYLDKETHWSDFQALVRRPVSSWIEVTEDALLALYSETAGNPYFTKLICSELFKVMTDRRDCYVTDREVKYAKSRVLQTLHVNSFQHFWQDGVLEDEERRQHVTLNRRLVLLAVADTMRRWGKVTQDEVLKEAAVHGLSHVTSLTELREFERRQILVGDESGYRCKVGLFGDWLRDFGVVHLGAMAAEIDADVSQRRIDDQAFVRGDEIHALVQQWPPYKGQRVSSDHVRAWLAQFGSSVDQRLMFRLLGGITFYSDHLVRTKLKEAHGIVTRSLVTRIERRQRRDVVLSYLDGPGKSGAKFVSLYADENRVNPECIVTLDALQSILPRMEEAKLLVFIDDFIGSGNSAASNVAKLSGEVGEILRDRGIGCLFIAVVGFEGSKLKIESAAESSHLPMDVHICDPINQSARFFSEQSSVFASDRDREDARVLASRFGSRLVKNAPLGHENGQCGIVFESGCPNNCLPILWQESKEWTPLFRRL
jgi:hypothetical protein